MLDVDPRLQGEWPDTAVLCWGVSYSLATHLLLTEAMIGNWLQDALDEADPEDAVHEYPHEAMAVVPTPEGFLGRIDYGSLRCSPCSSNTWRSTECAKGVCGSSRSVLT